MFEKKRKNKPCKKHRLAAPDWTTPEVVGMSKYIQLSKCRKCGWIQVKEDKAAG